MGGYLGLVMFGVTREFGDTHLLIGVVPRHLQLLLQLRFFCFTSYRQPSLQPRSPLQADLICSKDKFHETSVGIDDVLDILLRSGIEVCRVAKLQGVPMDLV